MQLEAILEEDKSDLESNAADKDRLGTYASVVDKEQEEKDFKLLEMMPLFGASSFVLTEKEEDMQEIE